MTFDPSEIVLDVKGNQILSIYLILLVVSRLLISTQMES